MAKTKRSATDGTDGASIQLIQAHERLAPSHRASATAPAIRTTRTRPVVPRTDQAAAPAAAIAVTDQWRLSQSSPRLPASASDRKTSGSAASVPSARIRTGASAVTERVPETGEAVAAIDSAGTRSAIDR